MKDLSVTAKYTAHCWMFGKFECAELLDTEEAKFVFDVTNAVLDLTSGKAAPSLPHSLVQRHTIIDRLLTDWLHEHGESGQVIELAAGLSARGVRFTDAFVTTEVHGQASDPFTTVLPDYASFAFTNPIWVDADGDGSWAPPGLAAP